MKKRPCDINQLAALIVDQATNKEPATTPTDQPEKNKAAQELGRLGGKVGGKRRAEVLTAQRKSEIAYKAAQARWSKKPRGENE